MFTIAKVLIQNEAGNYLILYRNNHPRFGNSIDLPGGTVEKGERLEDGAIREVKEECGITLAEKDLNLLVSTRKYSRMRNAYNLYRAVIAGEPTVELSWEHSEYTWLSRDELLVMAKQTKDSYMKMVADILSQ